VASLEFRLATLGRLCLTDANDQIVANGGKHLVLLAYLARSSPRPVRREVLATLLWGEKDETRARQSLRQALLRLKRELGECLQVSADAAAVVSVELDIAAFESEVEAGRLSDAVARWRGDFLLEQEDAGSEDYRAWIDGERAGLRRRLFAALPRLVDDATRRRAFQDAVRYATMWSELAPLDDEARRRREAALQQSDRHAELPHATVRQAALVGRSAQLAALEAMWSRIDDEGSVVVIEGEQGIGKSSFAREFVRRREKQSWSLILQTAAADDVDMLSTARRLLTGLRYANGLAGASDRSLAVLSSLVPTLRERFARLPDAAGQDIPAALNEVLAAVSEESPVLLFVDDVDRGDSATQQLLRDLMQRVPSRIMVLVTAEHGWFDAFSRGVDLGAVRQVKLQRLTRGEIRELVASMVTIDPTGVDTLAAELDADADGNPFYIAALISAWIDNGRLSADASGRWHLNEPMRNAHVLPARARDAVRARVAGLTRDARVLLEVIAVFEEPVPAARLEAVAASLGIEWKAALTELLAAGIIEIPNGVEAYCFSKRLFRHGVAETITPTLRARIEAGARPRRRPPYARLAAAAVIVVGCAAGAITLLDDDSAALAGSSRRLAVVALQNETGQANLDALGRLAAEHLTQGIAKAALLKVTPPVLDLATKASSSDRVASDVVQAAADATGADLIVAGSYYRQGDSIHFQARLTDVRSGRVLHAFPAVRAALGNPITGVDQLLEKALAALGALVDMRIANAAAVQSSPPSFAAYQEFERGLDYIFKRQGTDARVHLQRAYEMDTTWLLPLLYLTSAHLGEVHMQVADSLTRFISLRRKELTPYERAMLDAMIARVTIDVPAYYAAARAGAEIAPRSTFATVDLPQAAINLNMPGEALAVLTRINVDSTDGRDMPARWLMHSSALHMLGKYDQQLAMAKELQRRLPFEFRAVFYEGRSLAAMGRMNELDKVLDHALKLPTNSEWGPHGLRMYVAISDELRVHSHPEKAREVLERAIRYYGKAPADVKRIPKFRFDFAQALYRLGRFREARAMFEELLAHGNVMGASEIVLRAHLAFVAAGQGDMRTVRETEEWLKQYRDPYIVSHATLYRASIQALLGNREEAVDLLQQFIAQGGSFEANTHTIPEFNSLQGYPPYEEWLRPKG